MIITTKRTPEEVLKLYWGYDGFRLIQKEIIDNVLSGNDTFALMETGGGKSICFQLPTMMADGMTIVISPLIALMKDQVDALKKHGISAAYVNSTMDKRSINSIYIDCSAGRYKFLYLAPERLKNMSFLRTVMSWNISFIVVDEGHTISQWGFDFRTSYQSIGKFKTCFPKAPLIVLTATANEYVKKEIIKTLELREGFKIIQSTFARSNLRISVFEESKKINYIRAYLSERKGQTGIIYTDRRKKAEKIAELLKKEGFSAEFYHGGLGHIQRTMRQENWISGKANVMVCTNAFGMGIDKDNVRFVFHVDFPKSLEGYYQEIGRGGRDGKEADAIFLYSSSDIKDHIRQEIKHADFEQTRDLYFWLLGNYGEKINKGSMFVLRIDEVAMKLQENEARTFAAFKILETHNYLSMQSSSSAKAKIAVQKTKEEIKEITSNNLDLTVIVFRMWKLLKGRKSFQKQIRIDLAKWRGECKMDLAKFNRNLKLLIESNVISCELEKPSYLTKVTKRVDHESFNLRMDEVTERQGYLDKQQDSLMSFVANTNICRLKYILYYFGEHTDTDCGKCDVCLSKNNN